MQIIEITEDNTSQAGILVSDFRVTLKSYKGIDAKPDINVKKELMEYLRMGFPCFAAVQDGGFVGYAVCRVDEPCVW